MQKDRPKLIPVKCSCRIAAVLALLIGAACSNTPDDPEALRHAQRMAPTGQSVAFDAQRYKNFNDYINKTEAHLRAYKVFFDPENTEDELRAASPFVLTPSQIEANAPCKDTATDTRGIVLIHGLSDQPAAMRDLSVAFAQRCFTVYSMLLPAHGSRPSELMNVSRQDWIEAVQFGVASLKQQVDRVYTGGFSLGGLLALQAALDDPEIKGVFAFSPAFALHRSFYLDQTVWLRHLLDWVDTDLPDDPWRFESMPLNALAETQLLARSTRKQLQADPLTTPVFLAQSPDDAVVNAEVNRALFEKHMVSKASRLISYEGNGSQKEQEGRLIKYPSVLPEEKILGYAHQAVHIAPDNDHYGSNGRYRSCQHDINQGLVAINNCKTMKAPYRGEVFGAAVKRYNKAQATPIARLTFNPQFATLLDEIDAFLNTAL